MAQNPSIEASAVLRPNGRWSVCIGRESVFRRLIRRPSQNHALEQRLGMMASCIAAMTSVAFEEAGIQHHEIRVRIEHLCAPDDSPMVIVHIAVECEAEQSTAQSLCDSKVRSNPVFATLTSDTRQVEFRVQTYSSIHLRIS